MVLVHGMDIQCHKEGGDGLNFYIQASNPRFQDSINIYDESLSDAIESVFPLNTEIGRASCRERVLRNV